MKSGSLRRSLLLGPMQFLTPRDQRSTRYPHADTLLPRSRATSTPTRPPDSPSSRAQSLTCWVLACHSDPMISARDGRVRAIRMASATSSSARRVRFSRERAEIREWAGDYDPARFDLATAKVTVAAI